MWRWVGVLDQRKTVNDVCYRSITRTDDASMRTAVFRAHFLSSSLSQRQVCGGSKIGEVDSKKFALHAFPLIVERAENITTKGS